MSGAKKANDTQEYNLAAAAGSYPVVIGVTGMSSPVDIQNNKVYRITLHVAGPGNNGPEGKANFFVKCAVADWTAVSQSAVIK
ncbi:MAG: hypothetical protein LUH63_01355 [Parabacteroides sp.]|nr:hypothetical protein [Parabacteroides sp.]